jgi:hypothetical protein
MTRSSMVKHAVPSFLECRDRRDEGTWAIQCCCVRSSGTIQIAVSSHSAVHASFKSVVQFKNRMTFEQFLSYRDRANLFQMKNLLCVQFKHLHGIGWHNMIELRSSDLDSRLRGNDARWSSYRISLSKAIAC